MMAVNQFSVCFLVLNFLWTSSRGDVEHVCDVKEQCILPCTFEVGDEVVIHWILLGNIQVHLYHNTDQFRLQDQRFSGRTSLFKDQIAKGNASLQLTGVTLQDEGRYKCYTSTIRKSKESFINLKVEAPVRKVNIQLAGNNITCSSEGIYPEPKLTWSTTPPSNMNPDNTPTVQQNEMQLYSISSSLVLSDSDADVVYSCTVSTSTNRRIATLSKTRDDFQSCSWFESGNRWTSSGDSTTVRLSWTGKGLVAVTQSQRGGGSR
uniref:Ig-like domain-containing protein n=1 Tax=Amphiprion ocellaris TaxID=80972 RepID=A0A3Q1AI68_AMPOC